MILVKIQHSPSNTMKQAIEECFETVTAMQEQEESYRSDCWIESDSLVSDSSSGEDCFSRNKTVDVECRDKMAAWIYQVSDYCKYQRDTPEIAISILDRFLCTDEGNLSRTNRKSYQLASITALYTAVKLNETVFMSPKVMSLLSREFHKPKDVEDMEKKMLNALKWRVDPPTSRSFVRVLMDLIPEELLDETVRPVIYDLSYCQAELAVGMYDLLPIPKSIVAFSAIMNALSRVRLDEKVVGRIQAVLAKALRIDPKSDLIDDLQTILLRVSADCKTLIMQPSDKTRDDVKRESHSRGKDGICGNFSPRSVSDS